MSVNTATRRGKTVRAPRPGSWEATHPPFTFRGTLEDQRRVRAIALETGISLSDLHRMGLGLIERDLLTWRAGRQAGLERFTSPCAECGKPMLIDLVAHPELRPIAQEPFRAFCHAKCLP